MNITLAIVMMNNDESGPRVWSACLATCRAPTWALQESFHMFFFFANTRAIEVHSRLLSPSSPSLPDILTGNLIYLWAFMLALSGIKVASHWKES